MEVAWLRKALLNLDEEAAYIAQDNPQAARQVVMRILFKQLSYCGTSPGSDDPAGFLEPVNCLSPEPVT